MDNEKSLQELTVLMLCDPLLSFYGLFMAEMNKTFSPKFPTAGVCGGKGGVELILGDEFWNKTLFTQGRKGFIVIHELEHVIREHIFSIYKELCPDHEIANIAMDLTINQDCEHLAGNANAKFRLEPVKIDEKGRKCGVWIDNFTKLKLKRNESTMYYYGELMKAKEQKQESKDKGEDSQSLPKGNKQGTSGDPELDGFLDGTAEGYNREGDWHGTWKELTDGMSDAQKDLLKKEIQETLKRVADETQKVKGTIPAHLEQAIKDNFGIQPQVISWKTLFNRFIGSTVSTDVYQTRKRPNFRFEDAPVSKYKTKVKIICGIDESGSVGEEELEEFFSQVKHMHKAGVHVDIALWDAEVHHTYQYKGEMILKRVCGGGTEASSFIRYVNENKSKENWTCAITLTDGYIEQNPDKCKIPMLWVISSGGSTEFDHHAKKVKIN